MRTATIVFKSITPAAIMALAMVWAWAMPVARADNTDLTLPMALVKECRVVNLLELQADLSVLRFDDYKTLVCALGQQRAGALLAPAIGNGLAARTDEYERLMAEQLNTRLQPFEMQPVLDKQGRSPFARSDNDALSQSIRAIGPQTVRMGADIAEKALRDTLAKATQDGQVTPGAPCKA